MATGSTVQERTSGERAATRPSVRIIFGWVILSATSLVALAVAFLGYPSAISWTADLGDCSGACLSEAETTARTVGLLVLLPFLSAAWLIAGLRRSVRRFRLSWWLPLLGAYAAFFVSTYLAARG